MSEPGFKQKVEELVAQIPKGRVISYGHIAVLCGSPRAARQVGQVAHFGNPNLPWQRVIKKDGGLASGFPGGMNEHRHLLIEDGVEVSDDFVVDINKYLWQP